MSEDILHQIRVTCRNREIEMNERYIATSKVTNVCFGCSKMLLKMAILAKNGLFAHTGTVLVKVAVASEITLSADSTTSERALLAISVE